MNQNLETIKIQSEQEISAAKNLEEIETIRIKYLGRNGILNDFFSAITNKEKKQYGSDFSLVKRLVSLSIVEKKLELSNTQTKIIKKETKNIFSLPKIGHLHPITQTERQLNEVFRKLGFSVYNSPEIVTDEFNFERLNVPQIIPLATCKTVFISKSQNTYFVPKLPPSNHIY